MHSLLKAAHDAAHVDDRPAPPHHGGVDANPQLGAFGFSGVAIFMAESLSASVKTRSDRQPFIRWLGVARDIYGKHARADGKEVKEGTKTKLRVLSKEQRRDLERELPFGTIIRDTAELSPAVAASMAAAAAAYDAEMQNGGPYITSALRDLMKRIVPALPKEHVRAFLLDLDRCLLREEVRALLARRRDPRCERVTACVWRAVGDRRARQGRASGAQVTHWIGKLAADPPKPPSYLLIGKVGSRWQLQAGTRDEVLATVPDALMESATAAVFANITSRP